MVKWQNFQQPHLRITAIYAIVASLWILFSDTVLVFIGFDDMLLSKISMLKGMLFVFVTSSILFAYLRREFRVRYQLEKELLEKVAHVRDSQSALEQSEHRFRKAVEEAPMPIIIFAEDGQVLAISRTWLEITGYTAEQLKTIHAWTELAYGTGKQPMEAIINRLFDLKQRVDEGEFVIRCADGSTRIWAFSSTPLGYSHDHRRTVISMAADVTERKYAEEQLRVKDSAIASSITPTMLADLSGKLTYVNDAFLDLWKLTDEAQALGRTLLDFWLSEDDAQEMLDVLLTHDNFVGELTARLTNGSSVDVELMATIVRDESDQPICMMGLISDISKQKQAEHYALENERLKARFQKEQERNVLVQRIISALSHDLRTPLTLISTSRDMLIHYADRMSDEKRLERLDTIGRQVQFALELLEDTVNLARGNLTDVPFRPSMVNISVLCRVSVDEIRTADNIKRQLRFVNLSTLETVSIDETLVSRILLNLLSNAIKYSPEDSEIRLELDEGDQSLILRVIDQGIGINEVDLPHIFDPFYRAQNVNAISGTGLGLSIVQECVERHMGHIHVTSTPGVGSTFTVELPI